VQPPRLPTVPEVVDALLTPSAESARSLRTEVSTLLEDGRDVALEPRRLVHGDLCGMFDGPTTTGLDLMAPLVVLDHSALYSSAALGVLMACATAWLQAALTRAAGTEGGSDTSSSLSMRRGPSFRISGCDKPVSRSDLRDRRSGPMPTGGGVLWKPKTARRRLSSLAGGGGS
jgi:hypothetical protein